MSAKKIGRPTEAKKDFMLRARLDNETLKKLNELSAKEKVSKAEIVRRSIIDLYNKKD